MKYICRKCNFVFEEVKTFADLEEIQETKCGAYGCHRIVGVLN